MEVFIIILVVILLLLSLVGSVVPSLPGPPLSYVALLLYHLFIDSIENHLLIWLAVLVLIVTFLDYYLQIYGVKKAGGGKYAVRGSIVGVLLGLFIFPPIGILLGAFIGAFIGAKIENENNDNIKIAFGAVWGFILGTVLKICTSFYIVYVIFLK